MNFDKSILREADIRGIYPSQITEDFAYRLGLVFGTFIRNNNNEFCVVGHDNRFGGEELTNSLIRGLMNTGVNVLYIGLVTTPMLNYASRELGHFYGVMVTASHNPSDNNGFKLFGQDYLHCSHDELDIIYNDLSDINFKSIEGNGTIENIDIYDEYSTYLASSIKTNDKHLHVVVDCGNGTSSVIIKEVYNKLPFEVTYINSESDPSFPNHHPDPNVKENLKQLQDEVLRVGADIGASYDGDADRCGFVDNLGNIIEADVMMAIMSKSIIEKSKNKKILIDVKCSNLLVDEINKNGGIAIMDTVSSARQEEIIFKNDIDFGGGYSNHIFFHDRHPGYDDGIYVGLRIQEMLLNTNNTLNELASKLNKYYNTEEIKIKTKDEIKFKIIDKIKEYADSKNYKYNDADGLRIIKDKSWALLRASNTGPNLTLRFEADTEEGLNNIQEEFTSVLNPLL